MARHTHLLDTSALLAHYLDEEGAAEVAALWNVPSHRLAVSVLSIPELATRLRIELDGEEDVDEVMTLYFGELTTPITIDREVADIAAHLRRMSTTRLPLVDACIAACAQTANCVLVHRDPHFRALPPELLRQQELGKASS